MKIGLLIAGVLCDLTGIVVVLVVVDLFQHPRGMGTEKIMGPVLGVIAFCLFAAGAGCLVFSRRIRERSKGQ